MSNSTEPTITCPACRSTGCDVLESIPILRLAEAWSRDWPGESKKTVEEIHGFIHHDLQTEEVAFLICPKCSLQFSSPMKTWTSSHYPAQSHGLGFDQLAALDVLRNVPPCRVLEIGCGCGEFLLAANKLGHTSLGLDFSQESILKAQSLGVDARLMDMKQLASLNEHAGSYDVITMFQVIEHLEYPDDVFDGIAQLVKPSALLLAGCPAPKRFTKAVNHAHRVGTSDFWDFPPQHPLRWNETAMSAFLKRHHWQVEEFRHEPFSVVGAAAQLVAIDSTHKPHPNKVSRKLSTLKRQIELWFHSKMSSVTGIRMFVKARTNR